MINATLHDTVTAVTQTVTWGDKSRTVTIEADDGMMIDVLLTRVVLITGASLENVKNVYHRVLVEYPWYDPLRHAKILWNYAWDTGKLFDEFDNEQD